MLLESMQVLIQNCDTHEFYAGPNGWSRSAAEAKDFLGTLPALETIRRENLRRAQIVLKFSRSDMDIVLELGDCKDVARN